MAQKPPGWNTHAGRLKAAVAGYAGKPPYAALNVALQALADANLPLAVDRARAALALDAGCGVAWRVMGLALEGQGDAVAALDAYQAAYALDPASHDLLADLGRLARTLGLGEVAAELFARALAADPQSAHLTEQLALALRDGHNYDQAVEVLRSAIEADPANAALWNALGAVLLQKGDTPNALVFLEQALDLKPGWIEALYNRAIARFELGDPVGAAADCDAALIKATPDQTPKLLFVRAQARLSQGDLERGWADYEARLDPRLETAPIFSVPGRPLRLEDRLEGRRLLVVGEQGLGDEIMFAGMIPDLIQALGPSGRLSLAVAPRLAALFQRSFPDAEVGAHQVSSDGGRAVIQAPFAARDIDLWTPMGALTPRFRGDLSGFEGQGAYLVPDPEAVAGWRRRLAALDDRSKIGLTWKSMKTSGDRLKQYPPFDAWKALLRIPGVRFVTLQYGDCEAEWDEARAMGADIWSPPGLDLTQDLDGAAALSAALDLVIGVGNASANLAAAVGAPTWILNPPGAWPRLGTDHYPWFPHTRVFGAEGFGDWAAVMAAVEQALKAQFGA